MGKSWPCAYAGVDVLIQIFLTSALVGGEWSASCPGRFKDKERASSIHWIGACVGPRTGLDNIEKGKFLSLPGLKPGPFNHPAHRLSLHQCTLLALIKL
jgi:hypothetical protein